MNLTIGRSNRFTNTTNAVAIAACAHIAGAGQDADRGGAPQRRRSIEAANIQAVAEDNACPQKANAREYLRGDPGRARLSREERREDNEARGPERHQRVRAQTGQPIAPLALEPHDRPKCDCYGEVDRSLLRRNHHVSPPPSGYGDWYLEPRRWRIDTSLVNELCKAGALQPLSEASKALRVRLQFRPPTASVTIRISTRPAATTR
jgi:hypothetical protein